MALLRMMNSKRDRYAGTAESGAFYRSLYLSGYTEAGLLMAGRKAIPAGTKLRLFSDAGGHCQNANCLEPLFPPELGGVRHVAEMAHVIPHGKAGPRREDRPSGDFNPDTVENLILLCPTCHRKVDKAPDHFPRDLLLGWKRNHLAKLALKQGIKPYENRAEARAVVANLLQENKAIWERFAPEHGSNFEYDPEAEAARAWTHRMRSVILPNHYRIQAIVEANLNLLSDEERRSFAEYQEHVRGLSERHVCDVAGRAIRFPEVMEGIFT